MSGPVERKFELKELTVDNFVNLPGGEKLSACNRCKKIIIDSIYDNGECVHIICRACYNDFYAMKHGSGNCTECTVVDTHWTISHILTRKLHFLCLRCPIVSCGQIYRLDELKIHNLRHIKPLPHTWRFINVLSKILNILAIVSIIAIILPILGNCAFSSESLIVCNVPYKIVFLPGCYYQFHHAAMAVMILCVPLIFTNKIRYQDPILKHIDKKIATCCEE